MSDYDVMRLAEDPTNTDNMGRLPLPTAGPLIALSPEASVSLLVSDSLTFTVAPDARFARDKGGYHG